MQYTLPIVDQSHYPSKVSWSVTLSDSHTEFKIQSSMNQPIVFVKVELILELILDSSDSCLFVFTGKIGSKHCKDLKMR